MDAKNNVIKIDKRFFFQIQKQRFKIKTVFDFTHYIRFEKINEKQSCPGKPGKKRLVKYLSINNAEKPNIPF